MFKRISSLLLVFAMIMTIIPTVNAEELGPVKSIADPIADCNEFTPPSNIFKIEGDNTEFILLNTTFDDNSKFYVMMKDDVGTMPFDTDGTQKFDAEDSNNIGYWLNNDFLNTGGLNGNKLPDKIKEYIPVANFPTEAGNPDGNAPKGYTVSCKISLLSQTEYSKFYKNFGIRDNMEGSAWWLRTAFSKTGKDTMLVPKISDQQVTGRTIQWPSSNKLLIRPVFYLTKDFFKNVKLQAPSLGSSVKRAILSSYTLDELKNAGYSSDEIEIIKDTSSDVSEKFELSMPQKEEIGKMMTPDVAQFDIKGLISGTKAKEFSIYFECKELGIPNTVSKVEITPGVEFNKTFKLKGIKNGVGVLKVTIKQGDRVSCSMQDNLYIMPKYEKHFMENMSQHGMGTHYPQAGQSNSNDTEMLIRGGFKQIRDSIGWTALEQPDGSWSSQKTDAYVPDVTKRAGIDWTAIIYGQNENYIQGNLAPSAPSEITGFANYANHISEFYPQIDRFEIWNEPNLSSWRPKPNALEYEKVAKAVGRTLMESNPNAHVIAGSINSFDNTYTRNMMKDGLYPYMTHYSYHPYITPARVDDAYEQKWQPLLNTTLSYGGWKDIYVTEVGWPTHISPTGNTEEMQAKEVPKMYVVADAMNLKNNAYYTFRNTGNDPRENEDNFGVIKRNFEPKPAFVSASEINIQLGGAVYFGQMFMNGDLTAHVYMKDHEPVVVMWNTKLNGKTNYDFGEDVTVLDQYGNKMEPISGNTYEIGETICYVKGANKSWFNKAIAQYEGKKMDDLLNNYSKGIPAEIINNLKQSGDYIKSLADAATIPSESEISDKMSFHYQQGTNLLNAYKAGGLNMTDTDVSIALFLMHRIGVGYGNLLAAASNTAEAITSTDRVAKLRNQIKEKSKANYDGSLQFTEAITYYAAQHNIDALNVQGDELSNPSKNGIIKAYDRLSNELLNWAEIWVNFEPVKSTAFLIEVPVSDTSVFTGEPREINVGIRSFSSTPQTGTVQIIDPNGVKFAESAPFTVEPNTVTQTKMQASFNFDFQNLPREFTMKFVNDKQVELGTSLVTYTVKDKVTATYDPINTTVDKASELKLNLKNIYTGPVSGTVTLTPPEGWTLATTTAGFALDKDGSQTLTFKVNSTSSRPFNIYTIKTAIKDENGLDLLNVDYPLSFTPIVKNTSSISLQNFKGDISDWADAYPVFINQPTNSASLSDWKKSDIAGMVFLKWDNDNLYMLYNIYDDKYIQQNVGSGIWSGDSVQYSLDCNNSKTTAYDLDDYEIGFSYTTNGLESYCWTAPDASKGGEWKDNLISMYRDDNLRLTRTLVVMPKSKVEPLELTKGHKIGFNVAINDADIDKREQYVQITNGTANGKNPSFYYTFEMVDGQPSQSLDMIKQYSMPVDLTLDSEHNFSSFGAVIAVNTDADEETAMFKDLIGHWARADVEDMANRKIVNGTGDKVFEPDRSITRAEFTALLAKSGIDNKAYTGNLSDVKAGDWYADYIESAIENNIIPSQMYSDGAFYPDKPITREEMAVMTVNMYAFKKGIPLEAGISVFTDESSFKPWAIDAINSAYKAGIVNGLSEGVFGPSESATRAEATVIVKRLLAKI